MPGKVVHTEIGSAEALTVTDGVSPLAQALKLFVEIMKKEGVNRLKDAGEDEIAIEIEQKEEIDDKIEVLIDIDTPII